MNNNYSIVIQWSQKDNCFVATLPEWGDRNTQGDSYEQALANAQKILSYLIDSSIAKKQSLPKVKTFQVASVVR